MPKPKPSTKLPLRVQSTWVYFPEAGVYSWSAITDKPQQLHGADMVMESYAPVQLESPTQLAALKSQLAPLLTVVHPEGVQLWAPQTQIEYVERCPVVLAFRAQLNQNEADTNVRLLQPLPPPQLGECALVWHSGAWHLKEKPHLGAV